MLRGDDEPQGHVLLNLYRHNRLHHRFGPQSGQEAPEPPSESQDWVEDQRVKGAGDTGEKSQGWGKMAEEQKNQEDGRVVDGD